MKIKLKAWVKKYKVMCEVASIDFENEIVVLKLGNGYYAVPVEEVNILRYIGLEDLKKKEIYEGDIVQILHHDYLTYHKVVYCADKDGYPAFDLEPTISDEFNSLQYAVEELGVVIAGNIYENPELVNEGK